MVILVEQAVYGSFPFWDRGYDVLARSPGLKSRTLAEALDACRSIGEAPSSVEPAPALFSKELPCGSRAIVGVGPLGLDDRGRPGALVFHILILERDAFRRAGANPFAFASSLRLDWSAADRHVPTLDWSETRPEPPVERDGRTARVVSALRSGRRVALESPRPIDALARSVWAELPRARRQRASVATWAFGNANRFDLLALPRLAGVTLDRSYVEPASIETDSPDQVHVPESKWRVTLTVSIILCLVAAAAWGWEWSRERAAVPDVIGVKSPPPALSAEERAELVGAIDRLCDRLDGLELDPNPDPSARLISLIDRLRYLGPTLEPQALAQLAAETDPDRDRALAMHRLIQKYRRVEPLPPDFATQPLDRQLAEVGRRLGLDPALPRARIPAAIEAAIARDGPIQPTPLASRYPPLSDYARFLARLPRIER
jgi:hypothetical protein